MADNVFRTTRLLNLKSLSKSGLWRKMRTKILFYSAIGFFYLGFNSADSLLYFFFALYLFILSVCFYFYSRENRNLKTENDLVEDAENE